MSGYAATAAFWGVFASRGGVGVVFQTVLAEEGVGLRADSGRVALEAVEGDPCDDEVVLDEALC